jgi:hypothetical protein
MARLSFAMPLGSAGSCFLAMAPIGPLLNSHTGRLARTERCCRTNSVACSIQWPANTALPTTKAS